MIAAKTAGRLHERGRARLPRLDWHLLLPPTDQPRDNLVVLGATQAFTHTIEQSGMARRVHTSVPGQRCADALVVLSRSRAPVAQALACLKPGGAAYIEVDRRSPAGLAVSPGGLDLSLRRAGLTPTGAFWTAPELPACKRYIPLGAPGALAWYWSTLYVAGTLLHRLLEIGVGLYLAGGQRAFASIAPCFALTAVAGPACSGPRSLLEHAAVPEGLLEGEQQPILMTSGHDAASRAVVLSIGKHSREPAAVFKVAPQADFNANTEREQAVLSEIRARLKGAMRASIPRPLGVFRYRDLAVSIESCARGRPLLVTSGGWQAGVEQQVDDLRMAAGWLNQFHQQVQFGRQAWNEAARSRWVEGPMAAYARTFGLTASEERLFAQVRMQARHLAGSALPLVWMHYDFGPWNLYRHGRDFTVIDWEFGRNWERDRIGPALYDLLYFVSYWNHVVRHARSVAGELRALRALFLDPPDRLAHAVHAVIADYLATLDIDRRFVPVVLTYMWIEQALHQAHRKRELGEADAASRSRHRAVRYLGVLAERAPQLMARWGEAVGNSA